VPAFNAMSDGAALGDRVIEAIGLKEPASRNHVMNEDALDAAELQ
jgi:hypothetical protein